MSWKRILKTLLSLHHSISLSLSLFLSALQVLSMILNLGTKRIRFGSFGGFYTWGGEEKSSPSYARESRALGPGPVAAETAFYSNAHGPSSRQPRPNTALLEPNVMGPFRKPRGMEPMPKPKCRCLIVYAKENIHRILKYFSVEKLVRHLFLSIHSKNL